MPGHVKLGKPGEPDPDPSPYLVVTLEMKREDAMKPYDPKKSYWCPDGKGNYLECMLESDDGTKAVVMCGHEVKLIAKEILFSTRFLSLKHLFLLYITEKDLQV